jgi:uncharacterized protein (TIGR03067 family)
MRILLGLIITLSSCIVLGHLQAGDPATTDARKELKELDGAWQLVAMVRRGQDQPAEALREYISAIKDGIFSVRQGLLHTQAQIKVDPDKNPKTIDLTILEGKLKGEVVPGIYKLERRADVDYLTICHADPGQERPKVFVSGPDSGVYLMIYKREIAPLKKAVKLPTARLRRIRPGSTASSPRTSCSGTTRTSRRAFSTWAGKDFSSPASSPARAPWPRRSSTSSAPRIRPPGPRRPRATPSRRSRS